MAIYRRVTKCLQGHPLWVRNGREYFCKLCGEIDIVELMWAVDRKIRRLQLRRHITRKEMTNAFNTNTRVKT